MAATMATSAAAIAMPGRMTDVPYGDAHVLQEEDDLEALAIDAREAEDDQPCVTARPEPEASRRRLVLF